MRYQNILIVKLSAIGDVIHALPVAKALKDMYPDAKVTWVVEKPAYDLVSGNPAIDQVILFEKGKYKSLAGLLKHAPEFMRQLRSQRFDLVLDLQGLAKSAAIAFLSGASQRLGYCNMREMSHIVSRPVCGVNQYGHVVDRYLDVARAVNCTINEVQFPFPDTNVEGKAVAVIASRAGFSLDNPFVILAVGTNWPTKCWAAKEFSRLSDMLYERSVIPVLIGGPGDRYRAHEIMGNCVMPPVDLVAKTSMRQLMFLMKKAHAFVGGDTGPMHLAAALGVPVVALFGPTDPRRNGPYSPNSTVLQIDRPCKGCWRRECQTDCLGEISAERVLAGLLQYTYNI